MTIDRMRTGKIAKNAAIAALIDALNVKEPNVRGRLVTVFRKINILDVEELRRVVEGDNSEPNA